jgi:hypothetical protein
MSILGGDGSGSSSASYLYQSTAAYLSALKCSSLTRPYYHDYLKNYLGSDTRLSYTVSTGTDHSEKCNQRVNDEIFILLLASSYRFA